MNKKIKYIFIWAGLITSILAVITKLIIGDDIVWAAMSAIWIFNNLLSEKKVDELENQLNNQ